MVAMEIQYPLHVCWINLMTRIYQAFWEGNFYDKTGKHTAETACMSLSERERLHWNCHEKLHNSCANCVESLYENIWKVCMI